MTTYKHITAITNANGELEFHARKEEKPLHSHFPMNTSGAVRYQARLKEWEQSAQVFTAYSAQEETDILAAACRYAFDAMPELTFKAALEKGIDVTEFVNISETLTGKCGHFAFYKPPSKEEPVRFHPDGSLSAHEVSRIKEPVTETEESTIQQQRQMFYEIIILNQQGCDYLDILSQFKITRLPKA